MAKAYSLDYSTCLDIIGDMEAPGDKLELVLVTHETHVFVWDDDTVDGIIYDALCLDGYEDFTFVAHVGNDNGGSTYACRFIAGSYTTRFLSCNGDDETKQQNHNKLMHALFGNGVLFNIIIFQVALNALVVFLSHTPPNEPFVDFMDGLTRMNPVFHDAALSRLRDLYRKYEIQDVLREAEELFGCKDNCDWSKIYRRWSLKNHPDKGGDSETFIRAQRIIEQLKDFEDMKPRPLEYYSHLQRWLFYLLLIQHWLVLATDVVFYTTAAVRIMRFIMRRAPHNNYRPHAAAFSRPGGGSNK